jgi:hypothetical protein
VNIAQRLLVSAQQQKRQVVWLADLTRVQLERFLDVLKVDEFINGALRVTSDDAKNSVLGGHFV